MRSFYRDRALVRGCRRGGQDPPDPARTLALARQWRDLRGMLLARADADQVVLGRLYAGLETDFQGVERALQAGKQLRTLVWTEDIPGEIDAICGGDREISPPQSAAVLTCEQSRRAHS